ncbi:hypothetical protein P167DRAFT_436955 [Morchella conica CCBAS932]|uniref:Uncharacterized protein n=1 Tax=Morchella conica CCBAS932 TaxID=1392247 RepID=A0A3N4K9C6_9PEZI|nr:hypothetical protein P167DRAFT_436955 [Morchella conica CCBAS932]
MRTGSNFVLFAASFFSFLFCLVLMFTLTFCFGFCLLCVCGRYFVSFFSFFFLLSFVWILVSLNLGWVYGLLLHEMKSCVS